jgi:hypothetical protein
MAVDPGTFRQSVGERIGTKGGLRPRVARASGFPLPCKATVSRIKFECSAGELLGELGEGERRGGDQTTKASSLPSNKEMGISTAGTNPASTERA